MAIPNRFKQRPMDPAAFEKALQQLRELPPDPQATDDDLPPPPPPVVVMGFDYGRAKRRARPE